MMTAAPRLVPTSPAGRPAGPPAARTAAKLLVPGRRARALAASFCLALASSAGPVLAGEGDLDPSFSGDGMLTLGFGAGITTAARAVAIDDAGRIVLAGYTDASGDSDFVLFRLLPGGGFDTSFDGDGAATVVFDLGGALGDDASALAIQSDGKVIVAGRAVYSGDAVARVAVARRLDNGAPDPDFGSLGGGRTTLTLGVNARASDLEVLADGSILVAGEFDTGTSSGYDWFVAKLTEAGSLDTSFDGDGVAVISFDLGGNRQDGAYALAVQRDGKILICGYATAASGGLDVAAARLLDNGALDPAFSGDGKVTIPLLGAEDYAAGIGLGPAGSIILGGHAGGPGEGDALMLRLTAAGALDTSFGSGGLRTFRFGGTHDSFVDSLALQPDGQIVVAGRSFVTDPAFSGDMGVARLTPDGALDTSFSGDGRLEIAFDQGGYSGLSDLDSAAAAVAPGGGIVIVGSTQKSGPLDQYYADAAVARLWISLLHLDDLETGTTELWDAAAP